MARETFEIDFVASWARGELGPIYGQYFAHCTDAVLLGWCETLRVPFPAQKTHAAIVAALVAHSLKAGEAGKAGKATWCPPELVALDAAALAKTKRRNKKVED